MKISFLSSGAVAAICLAISTTVAFGQSKPGERVMPVTVCEVLANLMHYNGKTVAVVGRLDQVISMFDSRAFLAEDRCENPLATDGYVWPNKILIWRYWEEGLPKPPEDDPQIDHDALIQKLSIIRITTVLHAHKASLSKSYGSTIQNEWGIAHGSIFSAANLKKGCLDKFGCGGFYGAPVVIVVGTNGVRSLKDEERRNQKKSN